MFFLFLVICCSGVTSSAQHPPGTAEGALAFADHLRLSGDFYRAITEYKRVLFHWPEHPLASECRYRIGKSYLQGASYQEAIETLTPLIQHGLENEIQTKARNSLAEALYLSHDFQAADAVLATHVPQKPAMIYSRTWCHLKARDLPSANALWPINQPSPYDTIVPHLQSFQDLPHKKPTLSALLSAVIPGTGQFYTGRWRDGIVSFLVNGLCIGAITAAIDEEHYEAAALLGFFELGFYSANIYNAINNAHKYNRNVWDDQLAELEFIYGPPFLELD